MEQVAVVGSCGNAEHVLKGAALGSVHGQRFNLLNGVSIPDRYPLRVFNVPFLETHHSS
jgi:hypothetical protein